MSTSEPLSGADISSLHAEQGPIHVHVGGTAIFEGKPPAREEFLAHVERRLNLIPRFRQRVRQPPGSASRPVWEDDPQFDLARHVRQLALAKPGTEAQLAELVGWVMSEPLDFDRPLWQIYLIEGLQGKRFAAISKTHHALVDGIAAVDVGAVILDPDPKGTDLGLPEEPWEANTPGTNEMLISRLTQAQQRAIGFWREGARRALSPAAATVEAGKTARGFIELARNSEAVKPTILNEEIGRDRRVGYATTSLEQVKEAGKRGGGTVNDVILSASAGALRRFFEHRGTPLPKQFVALVPMSIRGPEDEGQLGNRLTALMVPLPLSEADPGRRLRIIAETTAKLKNSDGARAASMLIEASGWVPPTVNQALGQMGAALSPVNRMMPQRLPWNMVISNVPGPPMPVYLLGRRLSRIHPYVALSPQRRALSIGVISYDGKLMFGLVGDRDQIPDLDRITEFVDESVAEVLAL